MAECFFYLDRAGRGRFDAVHRRSRDWPDQRRSRTRLSGARLLIFPAGSFLAGAVEDCVATSLCPSLLIAIAAMAKPWLRESNVTTIVPRAVGPGAVRRRPFARVQRSCRDRAAAMTDAAGVVPSRHWRGLLARRVGAAAGFGAPAQPLADVLNRFSRSPCPGRPWRCRGLHSPSSSSRVLAH